MTHGLPRSRCLQRCSLVLVVLLLGISTLGSASKKKKAQPEPTPPPVKATFAPSITIPVSPLGFSAPGLYYLGRRDSMASLDFLDEDNVLFTFRVPGLIRRNAPNSEMESERRVRAVVLKLPQGAVVAETVWSVHDHSRYVYPLDHEQYLFRDQNDLYLGDASLQLKPFLHFPGPVVWVEVDPTRKYIVTGSEEAAAKKAASGEVPRPATAAVRMDTEDAPSGEDQRKFVLRVIRRSDGKVMLISRLRGAIHLPINGEGYLETIRSRGNAWLLNLNHFTGGSTILGSVESTCSPLINFVSSMQFLVSSCSSWDEAHLVSMSTEGKKLWEHPSTGTLIWPLLVTGASGSRVARETLVTTHAVSTNAPLSTEDIKGQDVQVMDAATGRVVLRAAATPILDAGGNVAISPSGRRAAILMEDYLQIFDLPESSLVPETAGKADP